MKITDEKIKKVIESGGFIRRSRKAWPETTACYHMGYTEELEFGYLENGSFHELDDDNRYAMRVEDLFADDWEVMA